MKIEQLKLQGFGSYATLQELNFCEALRFDHMFVISGKTGAGKTMIFDAIHYALYGQASGTDRQEKTLKSDFIAPGVCPFVELTFSLRGEKYTIYRSLQYEKKKTRGEGFTIENPKVRLNLPDGNVLTKVSEVNEEIVQILGFQAQQFKQLLMIPQGEFKKLLLAKSDERTKIFQKIFGTYVYEALQTRAKEEAAKRQKNVADKQIERLNLVHTFELMEDDEQLFTVLQSENPNLEKVIEIFRAELVKEQSQLERMKYAHAEQQKELAMLNQRFNQAKTVEELLEKKKTYQAQQIELEQQKMYEVEKKVELASAKRAQMVSPFYMRKVEALDAHIQVMKQLETEKQLLQDLEAKFAYVQEALEKAKESLQQKPELQKKKEEITQLKSIVVQYEEAKHKREILHKERTRCRVQVERLTNQLQEKQEEMKEISEALTEITQKKDEKSELIFAQMADEKVYEQMTQCLEKLETYLKQEKDFIRQQKKFSDMESAQTEKKRAYEYIQLQYDRNLAGLMARNLCEGEACPVCGSTVHPNPAHYEGEGIEKAEVEVYKQKYEKEQARYQEYILQLENGKTMLSMKGAEIGALLQTLQLDGNLQEILPKLQEIMKEMEQKLKLYHEKISLLSQDIAKEEAYIKQKEFLEIEKASHQKKIEKAKQEGAALQGREKVLEESCLTYEKALMGQIATVQELNQKEAKLVKEMDEMDEQLKGAQEQFSYLNGQVEKQKGIVESLQNQVNALVLKIEEKTKAYEESLLTQDFQTEAQFRHSLKSEDEMVQLQKWLTNYQQAFVQVQTKLDELQSQLKDVHMESASALEKDIAEKEQKLRTLQTEETNLFHMYKKNKDIQSHFVKITKGIEKEEVAYKEIATLAKVLNGDNPQKMSFERYVLGAYFEQIIDAANLRLKKMTQNRYTLVRKAEVGDKRKAAGLDLQVMDAYTGKLRDVSTLSGGESFKAALAMALGLADVVQAFAGGIQMDTIFIDEGFGSLDAEALDAAIDCLIDLQNEGRVVGVISHVEELKNRMPVRLEVVQKVEGSHAKFTKMMEVH